MRILAAALLIPALLAGCATPTSQLRSGLMDAGLSPNQAGCMAQRMTDKLSLAQLMKIRSLKNFNKDRLGNMTLDRFLHNVRSLNDSEIMTVTGRAAVGCAISG